MTVVQLHGKSLGRNTTSDRRNLVAALDIGSSKISCLIAEPVAAKHRMPGGAERISLRVLGVGHQLSRGVRSGAIINVDEAERAIEAPLPGCNSMQ